MKSLPRLLKRSGWIVFGLLLLVALLIPKHGKPPQDTASAPDKAAPAASDSTQPALTPPVGSGDGTIGLMGRGGPLYSQDDLGVSNADASLVSPGPAMGISVARPPVVNYVIKEGDTLSEVAEIYNTDVASIAAANNLTRRDIIQIGTELKIPTAQGVIYTVAKGDTLWDIAQSYGIAQEDIVQFNRIDADNPILPGQEIVLPGARPVPVAVAVASRSGGDSRPAPSAPPTGGGSGTYIWPVSGTITSVYGPRWGSFHYGLDIAAPSGTPIAAARSGTVIRAGWQSGYGNAVEISHGGGVSTHYGHLSSIAVSEGQQVNQGEMIGRVGSTGNSTGPHLDFEVRVNGSKVNPAPYLP